MVRLVWDNLSVHVLAVPPAEARHIARTFERHDTPTHGSSVNVLSQRLADRLQLESVLDRWEEQWLRGHAAVT